MSTDDRNNLYNVSDNGACRLDLCAFHSHELHDNKTCEIKPLIELDSGLTTAQIKIGIATAVSGLIVSGVCALAVLSVWVYHAINGRAMPDIPLLVTSIASAPFAAGVITTIRLPKRAAVKMEP